MDFNCSQCGFKLVYDPEDRVVNFCPNCGHMASDLLDVIGDLFNRLFVANRFRDAVRLYEKREYSQAARNAVTKVESYLRDKSGEQVDVLAAIGDLFSYDYDLKSNQMTRYPKIRINGLRNQAERNEQDGVKLLFMGLMKGVRNPLIHSNEKICSQRSFSLILICDLLLDLADNGSISIVKKVVPKKVNFFYGCDVGDLLKKKGVQIIIFHINDVQINFVMLKDGGDYIYGKEVFCGGDVKEHFVMGRYQGEPVYCLYQVIDRSYFDGDLHVTSINGYLYIGKKELKMFVGNNVIIQSRKWEIE
jgi:uncharacterized protein (TIGR02391 family)